MKLQDIDWLRGEIKLVQRKTLIPVILPLMPEAGEAVRSYRNESVVAFAVNVIGQPDIPDMILRKEFLKEKPEVKVVPRKSA